MRTQIFYPNSINNKEMRTTNVLRNLKVVNDIKIISMISKA